MKMNFLKYSTGIACLVLATFTSCNDLDLAPTNKFTDLNYWTSEAKASYSAPQAAQGFSQGSADDFAEITDDDDLPF